MIRRIAEAVAIFLSAAFFVFLVFLSFGDPIIRDLSVRWLALVSVLAWVIALPDRRAFAFALMGIGLGLNRLVIAVNDGQMPVPLRWTGGQPITVPLYVVMDDTTRLWWLSDWIFGGSPGDVFIIAGGALIILCTLRSPP